ncbi:unnamed protein product, partial [Trichogramma brassicae]
LNILKIDSNMSRNNPRPTSKKRLRRTPTLAKFTSKKKCKNCDKGVALEEHHCKKNFEGSAKAMEAYAAGQLVSNNAVFLKCDVQVGGVGADNDSGAILAMRQAGHPHIFKHSDKNHDSKGVVSELYRLKNKHKELNPKAIAYIKKCFNYCVNQCKGDSRMMAAGLKNIPNHCFNIHDDCGDWCGYLKDPENYKHTHHIKTEYKNRFNIVEELGSIESQAARAELKLTGLISTLNLPRSTMSALVPVLKNVITDSEIVKQMSLDRHRTGELMKRVLSPAHQEQFANKVSTRPTLNQLMKETFEGEDRNLDCKSCVRSTKHSKNVSNFTKTPKYLFVSLCRYLNDGEKVVKIHDHVAIDEVINLDLWFS